METIAGELMNLHYKHPIYIHHLIISQKDINNLLQEHLRMTKLLNLNPTDDIFSGSRRMSSTVIKCQGARGHWWVSRWLYHNPIFQTATYLYTCLRGWQSMFCIQNEGHPLLICTRSLWWQHYVFLLRQRGKNPFSESPNKFC